jgi:hypothetical protein
VVTAIVPVGLALVYPVLIGLPLMEPTSPTDRVDTALAAASPKDTLPELARELRDGGMSQAELLSFFDAARERHARDGDETGYAAILDTMDLIAGWCAPSQGLYSGPEQKA